MKYIIDLPEELDKASEECWKKATGMTLEPCSNLENEVWNLAREIAYCMSLQECEDAGMISDEDIYDSASGVLEKLNYQEAKSKFEAWKKQKDEIRVGDEVLDHLGKPYIIYKIQDVSAYGIRFDGYPLSHNCFPVCYNKKTGRHFDEVEKLLKKMGGVNRMIRYTLATPVIAMWRDWWR